MERWVGRIALVTGASAGIGASIASTLASKGMKVVACARRMVKLEEMAKLSKNIYPYQCDMSSTDEIKKMFDWIEGHADLQKIDVCICNAGVDLHKSLTNLSPDDMKQMMNINVISSNYCTQLSVKLMLKHKIDDGQIIFISSTTAHKIPGDTKVAFYSATKHALKCLLEGWRQELRSLDKNNIRVGAISPGLVKTEAIQVFTQNAAVADMIYASSPHIQTNDVTEAVLQIICAKPHVQIHDVVVRHVQEK